MGQANMEGIEESMREGNQDTTIMGLRRRGRRLNHPFRSEKKISPRREGEPKEREKKT